MRDGSSILYRIFITITKILIIPIGIIVGLIGIFGVSINYIAVPRQKITVEQEREGYYRYGEKCKSQDQCAVCRGVHCVYVVERLSHKFSFSINI